MRRRMAFLLAAASLVLVPGVSLQSHHAFTAEFDAAKPIEVTGTLVKLLWINPHSWIYLDETNPDGTVVPWEFELGNPTSLLRAGWRKDAIPLGIEIMVRGYRAKSGARRANAQEVLFPDGRELLVGSSAPDAPDDPNKPR